MKPKHIALALLVAALWGINFVAIKIGLKDFPPFLISALRFVVYTPKPLSQVDARAARS